MSKIVLFEFVMILLLIVAFILAYKVAKLKTKECDRLEEEIVKANLKSDCMKVMMETKDEAYRNSKEKNKKLDNGSMHDRIVAAGDVLCNDQARD